MGKKVKIVSGVTVLFAVVVMCALVFWWTQRIPPVRSDAPPSSAEIYQTLNTLWKKGDFNGIDGYVKKLQKKWCNYLPAQLALSKYYYKIEVDVNKSVEMLNVVNVSLTNDILHVSPLFRDELESQIIRYVDAKIFYQKHGGTKEELFKKLNPRTIDPKKRGKTWMDENLFYNTPEILFTREGIRPVKSAPDSPHSLSGIKDMDEEQLMKIVGGSYPPTLNRKAAVNELVSRRVARGKMEELLKGLYKAELLYTYHATADQVVQKGTEAIPSLLACLDKNKILTDRRKIIWPLIRIGDARPEVIQALEKIRDEIPPSLRDSPYAKQAIEYLKKSQQEVP